MPSQYDLMKGRNDGARGENAHALNANVLDVRVQNEYAHVAPHHDEYYFAQGEIVYEIPIALLTIS
jgi:hypothetical protein